MKEPIMEEFFAHAAICKQAAKAAIAERMRITGKRFWTASELIDAVQWYHTDSFRICFIPWKELQRYKTKHGNYNLSALFEVISNR